jgi:hypothetical protein
MKKIKIFKGELRLVEMLINEWFKNTENRLFNIIQIVQSVKEKEIIISIIYEISDGELDIN